MPSHFIWALFQCEDLLSLRRVCVLHPRDHTGLLGNMLHVLRPDAPPPLLSLRSQWEKHLTSSSSLLWRNIYVFISSIFSPLQTYPPLLLSPPFFELTQKIFLSANHRESCRVVGLLLSNGSKLKLEKSRPWQTGSWGRSQRFLKRRQPVAATEAFRVLDLHCSYKL